MTDTPTCRLCGQAVVLDGYPHRQVACDLAGRWVHVDCRNRQQAADHEGVA